MFKQMDFMRQIMCNIDYWMRENILESAVERYRKFQLLHKSHPNKLLVPTIDISLVWQAHKNIPESYQSYCRALTGSLIDEDLFLDRAYTKGIPIDWQKAYAHTFVWWSRQYHMQYSSYSPDFWAWQRRHHFISWAVPLVGMYRLTEWRLHGGGRSQKKGLVKMPPLRTMPPACLTAYSVIGTPMHEMPMAESLQMLAVDDGEDDVIFIPHSRSQEMCDTTIYDSPGFVAKKEHFTAPNSPLSEDGAVTEDGVMHTELDGTC